MAETLAAASIPNWGSPLIEASAGTGKTYTITSIVLRLLLAGACLNVLAFGWLIWHFPGLPAKVALWYQFDATAGHPTADALQPLGLAWQLPIVGLLALALNAVVAAAVHERARLGSLFLAVGGVILQMLVLVILLRMAP